MKKIIALRGRASSGKTSTIRLLPAFLLANGYSLIDGSMPPPTKGDFSAIFEKGEMKIGVTSAGDSHDLVHIPLKHFVDKGCDVCVCACRTCDRGPRGTNLAVNSFPSYPPQFVDKTIAPSQPQEPVVNQADARIVFSRI